ncbi:MAG: FtsH protease activity modulator HflK [Pseudomonadota bacterium]
MPWQDNSGNRGPWGQPPKGNNGGNQNNGGRGGNDTPDLEDLLEASRQRLKRAFPRGGRGGGNGGFGGRGGGGFQLNGTIIGLIAAGILALWLFSGIYQVNPGERALVTTFGKFTDIKAQGLKWHVPFPVQSVEIVLVDRTRTTEVGFRGKAQRGAEAFSESLMLTGDKNIADVTFSVDWDIDTTPQPEGDLPGPAKFVFNIERPDNLVRAVAEASMREVVGGNPLEPLLTSGRAGVSEQTQNLMQEALDAYDSGIRIIRVNYQKADAPPQVREAFLDVFNAGSEAERKVNDAQRYYNENIPRARGEAQQVLEGAAAYASRVTADARGQAERFNQVYDEYRQAPQVTRQRMYLETVESVLADMNKIVIEDDAGKGVVPYLPLNELNRSNSGAPRSGTGGQQ